MWPRTILVKLALATARLRQPPEAEVEAKYKTSYNDRGGKGGGVGPEIWTFAKQGEWYWDGFT